MNQHYRAVHNPHATFSTGPGGHPKVEVPAPRDERRGFIFFALALVLFGASTGLAYYYGVLDEIRQILQ